MNEVFAWFNNFTSLAGYTQYLSSKNPTSKIFWTILTVLGLFMTIISIERTFRDFLEFDVTTSVTVSGNSSLNFPTVTLCNSNRVNCLKLFQKIEICKEVKFIYSEKNTKFCEIFTLLLTGTTQDKSKVKISQNFVAFSEYINFTCKYLSSTQTRLK